MENEAICDNCIAAATNILNFQSWVKNCYNTLCLTDEIFSMKLNDQKA